MVRPTDPTPDRIIDAAMELFGRQGFRATTIGQIEQAAGLSVGAGGIYRHFPSKARLLAAGLERQVETSASLDTYFTGSPVNLGAPLHDVLVAIAAAALLRLRQERHLNRLLLRDLADFPDLLGQVRDSELRRVHLAFSAWLAAQLGDRRDVDVPAFAAALMGAVSHYWIMTDVFGGEHPLGIDEARFLSAVATLAERILTPS